MLTQNLHVSQKDTQNNKHLFRSETSHVGTLEEVLQVLIQIWDICVHSDLGERGREEGGREGRGDDSKGERSEGWKKLHTLYMHSGYSQ